MRGLGMAERSELQERVSPPRQLGETVSVVTPELAQTKTEPRAPVPPYRLTGAAMCMDQDGAGHHAQVHMERGTPQILHSPKTSSKPNTSQVQGATMHDSRCPMRGSW